ncbi:MAG: hypothetical protein M3321_01400 [Actinomycetota bacterium]|nr:hypothetical protein [Actinomycetota bacterium]
MLRFVTHHLFHGRARAGVLAAVLVVAAGGFVLLASTARTAELRVRGSVESNYRTAYDILVRPRGSFTALERRNGLVRDNYLSGIFGGISLAQYERIRRIRGVQTAAPIANLGYVLPFRNLRLPLDDAVDRDPVQLFRVELRWLAHNGHSRYPSETRYLYYTRIHPFEPGAVEVRPSGEAFDVCGGFRLGRPLAAGPFARPSYLACVSALSPEQGSEERVPTLGAGSATSVGLNVTAYFPILLAAVDPEQEARLVGLDRTVETGRYLRVTDSPRIDTVRGHRARFVPVIASTRTYVDELLQVEVERLSVPAGVDVAARLASAAAYGFVTQLPGRAVARREFVAAEFYEELLRYGLLFPYSYWTASETRYERRAPGRLRATTTTNPISIWRSPFFVESADYFQAPPSNQDTQFRRLTPYVSSNVIGPEGVVRQPTLLVVGRYDPDGLPGFSPLSRVPLETYYPPTLAPADEATARVLGGRPLRPTQNLGDYLQQPPLLLTTLEGMKPFLNPVFFKGAKSRARAPISVTRVRVAGVTGPNEVSQARIRAVALEIRERTGLDVDITAGSSPRTLELELPPGKFGRPALVLEEGWVKKGVSVAFLRAVDEKRLAIFSLILVACSFFVANGAFAVTRARRTEIGSLLCLGWPQGAIFRAVLLELAAIGVAAGLVGVGAAAAIVVAFSLETSLVQALLVLPVAVLLAVLAGLVPALLAARSVPLDAVRPAVAGKEEHRRVTGLATMGLVNLRRLPARALVGVAGLFVGVAVLTLLLAVNRSLEGTLVGTLLGEAILVRISGLDFVAVLLTIALAALSIADVLFLNLRERAAELVTLRTVGWRESDLRRLVGIEAFGLGLVGGLGGAVAGVVLSVAIDVPLAPVALAAVLAAAGGLVVVLVASLVPIAHVARLTAPVVLAEE